jgi:hypothetical protein
MDSEVVIIYAVLIILIIVGSWSLVSVSKSENMVGRAFVFSADGDLRLAQSGDTIDRSTRNSNITIWLTFVAVMIGLLVVVARAHRLTALKSRKKSKPQ